MEGDIVSVDGSAGDLYLEQLKQSMLNIVKSSINL